MNTFSHDEGNAIQPAVNDRASNEQSQQQHLLAASERLLTARTVPEVVEVLRDTARESVGADGIAVVLKDGDRCTYVAEDAVSTLWQGESFPQDMCVSGWAMRHRQTVSIRDVRLDERIPQEAYARTSVRSLVMVPIGDPEPVAALGAYWSEVADHDEATIERMEAMARLAAVAVENARLSTARDRAHALSTAQNHILELAVQEAPLGEKLTAIVREVEALSTTGVLGSILLLEEDGKRLHHGAGPSLPPEYNAAIDGIEIGSCGTAAFTGKAVFVSDIANDPLWGAFRDLALSHDLRACWSTPIRSASGKLLGTFAMYHRQQRAPQPNDLEIVDFVVRTVALVIERSRSEASMRRSEARYRQIVEGSEDFAIVTFDAGGRVTGWNRGAENIIGYAADDVIGRPGDFFYTEEDQVSGAFHHEVERARREGRAANERWHLRADGKPFWGSGLMMPLAMDHGGFLKIFRDGTAEHDAEAGLRANEERLRFLAELEERLFRSADAEQAMAAATELLGRQIEASRCAYADVEVDGDAFHIRRDFVAPGVASSTGTYSLDLFGARAASDMRGGNVLVVRDVGAELNDVGVETFRSIGIEAIICCPLIKAGRLTAMMAIHQDQPRDWTAEEIALTRDVVERCWAHVERVGSEARLRDSEERLRLAVTNAEVGFWDVDIVNDVLIWPPRTKAMFGISPDVPVTMQDFYDGLHPDDREATSEAFAAAADPARRTLYDVDYRTIGKEDAALRWVAARGRGVFDDSGRCLRVAGTAVDITARKEAEEALYELNATLEARIERAIADRETAQEALRQSQKMEAMGQLTGGVAHDFNNLLTPIVGALDMLQRKGLGGEREQRLIDGAAKSADRAKTLVQRLLAFARRQPLQAVAVDVAKLVDGMGDLVSSTTGPQIKVVVEVADDLPAAQADPNQLEMAILNLAVNARDAMSDGGTLRISAVRGSVHAGERPGLRAGDYIQLSVADTGAGMDEATIARAIEPFFSTKGIGKGTGLGLSMVHGLASQLGGALAIQSAPGLGTNVELWLPLSGGAEDDANLPQEPTKVTRAGSVLLVDDEELVRISTADMLADLGYDVTEASSGEEALGIINGGKRFSLLVTDHLMPGMTGTDLAMRVRSARPHTAVLLVSGYAENEGIAPNLPRLTKPFRKDDLAASLAQLTI